MNASPNHSIAANPASALLCPAGIKFLFHHDTKVERQRGKRIKYSLLLVPNFVFFVPFVVKNAFFMLRGGQCGSHLAFSSRF
jgi:hypothetical protein